MAKAKKKVVKKAAKPMKKVAAKKAPAKKDAPKKSAPKKAVAKKVTTKAAPKKTTAPVSAPAKSKSGLIDLSDFVTPLDDRLIVQLKEMDRKTAGGLFIPDTVSDVSGNLEGVVIAVGRGHRDHKGRMRPMDVKRGDRVVFAEYAGNKIQLKNEELIILRESEVMGVLS